MERLKDYGCPPDCSKRSKTCHAECERHQKYREIAEEIRNEKIKAAWKDKMMGNKPFIKKKTLNTTFYIRRVREHMQVSRQKALITVFVVANAIKQGVIQARLAL